MSNKSESSTSEVIVVLAPSGRDAELAVQVLNESALDAEACRDGLDLCRRIQKGCGAVIIAEEALTTQSVNQLQSELRKQDSWSDLPIILLTSADVVRANEIFSQSGNISLLERPFSRLTLVRACEVALRARRKQYLTRSLLEDLKTAKDAADRANFAKTQFLANMSHEIRTPIGAIMGFIDLILEKDAPEETSLHYMSIVKRNSEQLLRLIDDILDLSKVEAGKLTIEHFQFRLPDFLADICSVMELKASEKGIRFHLSFTTPIPDQIRTDSTRLRQIISNVVGNAIKFSDKGAVGVSVSFDNSKLEFRVKDDGIGLTNEQQSRLFHPFTQGDSSTTRKFGGTGLGLVLSKKLSEALGGELYIADSQPNKGSTFVFSIAPMLPDSVQLVGEESIRFDKPTDNPLKKSQVLKGLRVLVVEDSLDNQILIQTYLRSYGAEIHLASDGQEGVDTALKENFDVVLMDVQMPRLDGHEATRKLRGSSYSKPIIALTAHAMAEEKKKCFQSGFTDYLTKPIQAARLVDTLSRYAYH